MTIKQHPFKKSLTRIVLLVFLYYFSGQLAFYFSIHDKIISYAAFFPEGIGLAFVLLFGYFMGVGVFLGQFLLAFLTGMPLESSLLIAFVNSALAMFGRLVLKKLNFHNDFRNTSSLVTLLLVSFLLLTPLSAVFTHWYFYSVKMIPDDRLFFSAIAWWISNASGQILLTPFILNVFFLIKKENRSILRENINWSSFLFWNAAGLVISLSIFCFMDRLPNQYTFLAFAVLFPFFLVASIRNHLISIFSVLILTNLTAYYCTSHQHGPFATGHVFSDYLHMNALLMGLALTAGILTVLLGNKRIIEKRQQRILDSFVDGVYICSREYTITYMNSALINMIGADKTGQKCYKSFYNTNEPCKWCVYPRLLKEKNIMSYEMKVPGLEQYRNVRNILLNDNEKLTIYYDITEQILQQRTIQKRLDYETAISHFSNSLLQGSNNEISAGLLAIQKGTNVSRVYIFRNYTDSNGNLMARMNNQVSIDDTPFYDEYPNIIVNYEKHSLLRWKERLEKNQIISGTIDQFGIEERKIMEHFHVKSIIIIPVFVHKNWWGFIGLDDIYEKRIWEPEDIRLLRTISEMTGFFYELKENEKFIAENNERLSDLVTTKDKLLSIIAHDLKNPFNAILNLTYLLLSDFEKIPDKEMLEYIKDINQSSEKAYQMLEDMLTWSRSDKGDFPYVPEIFSLRSIVKDTIKLKTTAAKKKNIQILNECSDFSLFGDPRMVRTVLRNLTSNAIKFTPKNGLISIESDGSNDDYCIVTVKDNGIGIEKEYLKKIFDINAKTTTLGTEQEKGTGLGLIISKEFVEKNKGEIWVESEKGKGSSFSFTLPRSSESVMVNRQIPVNKDAIQIGPLTIRVAEDEIVNQIVLRAMFEKQGHTIHIYSNGRDFLKNIEEDDAKFHYDVFLIDLHMPVMDGYQTIEKIHQIWKNSKKRPLLFITTGEQLGENDIKNSGVNGILTKPFSYQRFSLEYSYFLPEIKKPV